MPTNKSTTAERKPTHSPSPWSVKREGDSGGWQGIAIVAADGTVIANVVMSLGDLERGNARVLAAAPELLAALKRLSHIAVWDEDFDAKDRAEFDAAFRQAEEAIDLALRGRHPKYAEVPR